MKSKYFIDYSNSCRTTATTSEPDVADWFINHGYAEVTEEEYRREYARNLE